jgi:hypothetical protein
MTQSLNPHDPAKELNSVVQLSAPTTIMRLILFTLVIALAIGLLAIGGVVTILGVILLFLRDFILMNKDERLAARKPYTEPLTARQFLTVLLCIAISCLLVYAFDAVVIKYLYVILGLWVVCPHWWRWFYGKPVVSNIYQA